MKEPVVVRTDVSANTPAQHVYMGRREELIAEELRRGGIPAHSSRNGVHVKTGELTVHEEDGLRVFTWQPPEDEEVTTAPDGEEEDSEGEEEEEEEAEDGEGEDASVDSGDTIRVPVPAGDNNPEVKELKKETETTSKKKSKKKSKR